MQEQKGSSSPSISTLSIVQMNDVSASYDSKNYVLKNVKMSITRGSNYAIVGQSGSGKSTLLKLINGMMNPTQGKIMVDYKIPNVSDKKFKSFMHKIGYIPQNLGLIKNSTVLENILIGALPRVSGFNSFFKKFSDLEIDDAKKILKLVGLKGKAERKVYMLSGGEKRRVAIARALVQKPEIILADEIDLAIENGDLSVKSFDGYAQKMQSSIETMRKIVYAFYDKDFSFGDLAKRGDHLRAALTDCLIGNVDNNEFRELFDAMSDLADLPKPVEHGLTTASS